MILSKEVSFAFRRQTEFFSKSQECSAYRRALVFERQSPVASAGAPVRLAAKITENQNLQLPKFISTYFLETFAYNLVRGVNSFFLFIPMLLPVY